MREIDKGRWMIVSVNPIVGKRRRMADRVAPVSFYADQQARATREPLLHDLATPLCHTIDSCKAGIISMPLGIIQSVQRVFALCQRVPWGLLITATNLMASVSSRIALTTSLSPPFCRGFSKKKKGER